MRSPPPSSKSAVCDEPPAASAPSRVRSGGSRVPLPHRREPRRVEVGEPDAGRGRGSCARRRRTPGCTTAEDFYFAGPRRPRTRQFWARRPSGGGWSLLHPGIVRRVGVHGRAAVIERRRGAARSARVRCGRSGTARTRRRAWTATPRHRRARCRPRPPTRERTCAGVATHRAASSSEPYFDDGFTEELFLVRRGAPATVDEELDPVVRGIRCSAAQGTKQISVEVGDPRDLAVKDRRAVGNGTVSLAERTTARCAIDTDGRCSRRRRLRRRGRRGGRRRRRGWERRRGRGRQRLVGEGCGDRRARDEQAGDIDPANPSPTGRCRAGSR